MTAQFVGTRQQRAREASAGGYRDMPVERSNVWTASGALSRAKTGLVVLVVFERQLHFGPIEMDLPVL